MERGAVTDTDVRNALREVIDPELGINIVDLGLVYGIEIRDADVDVTMTMTTPACPLRDYLQDLVESAIVSRVVGVEHVTVTVVDDPPWTEDLMSDGARRQLA
jgi:metal-sulfur cluster biosynthetic enzyme